MAIVISLKNSKGGMAKTASCRNIAGVLTQEPYNKKVLLIDTDLSRDLTNSFEISEVSQDFYGMVSQYLANGCNTFPSGDVMDCITKTEIESIDIIQASEFGIPIIENFIREHPDKITLLRPFIKRLGKNYDYIFFDIGAAKSSRNIISKACLVASDYVLSPFFATQDGMNGVVDAIAETNEAAANPNADTKFLGAFISMFKRGVAMDKTIFEKGEVFFPGNFIPIAIRDSSEVGNASTSYKIPVSYAKPNAGITQDYRELTAYIVEHAVKVEE